MRCLKGEGAPDYLAVLVSMELSLHSLEVVSRLTSSLDLPQDFINHYIANCIASCDRAEVSQALTSWFGQLGHPRQSLLMLIRRHENDPAADAFNSLPEGSA